VGQDDVTVRVAGKPQGLRRVIVRGRIAESQWHPEPNTDVLFEGANCTSVDFSEATFDQFYTRNSIFDECNFRQTTLNGLFSGHPRSIFKRCVFDEADLVGIGPGHARFEDCSFENVLIRKWFATCSEFLDCRFSGRVETSKFFGRPRGNCADEPERSVNEFRGNDFRRADLRDVGFVAGIDLEAQQLPGGSRYVLIRDFHDRFEAVGHAIADWPASDRHQAENLLDAYSTGGMEDQRDLFARKDEIGSVPARVRDRVWELLEEKGAG
jgi:hypothetical protein